MRRPFDSWGELVDFLIVLSVCIAGLVSLMWWPAVPIGATALFCTAAGKYGKYVERLRAIDGMWKLYETLALSGLNALAVSSASFGLGLMVKWMWW